MWLRDNKFYGLNVYKRVKMCQHEGLLVINIGKFFGIPQNPAFRSDTSE